MISKHPKSNRFQHTRQVLQVWKYAWRPFLLFEIGYKLLTFGVFFPIISILFNKILDWGGYQAAANHELLRFVFSRYGLFCLVTLAPIAFLLIYLEYAVLIHIAYYGMHQKRARVIAVILRVLSQLPRLLRIGSFSIAVYLLLLFPLLDTGFGASLLPGLRLPNFVTGELLKTGYGLISLIVVSVTLIVINLFAIYALPILVLEHSNRFWPAFHKSREMFRRSKGELLKTILEWLVVSLIVAIIMILLVIGILTVVEHWIPTESTLSITLNLMLSFGIYANTLILTPLFITVLTWLYVKYADPQDIDVEITNWQVLRWKPGRFNNTVKTRKRIGATLGILIMLSLGWLMTSDFTLWGKSNENFLIMAHRGDMSTGVENTVEAIQGAIQSRADYVELDILQTKDGHVVVLHDVNLRRLTGENINMYDLSLEQLQHLTLRQNGHTGRIPTLDEVFTRFKGQIKMNIELKTHGREKSLIAAFIDAVRRHQMENEIIVQSLDYSIVNKVKSAAPDLTVGYVIYATFTDIGRYAADFYVIEESFVNARRIASAKLSNKPLYVWTVNSPEAIEHYYILGVDGVITDIPSTAREIREQLTEDASRMDGDYP